MKTDFKKLVLEESPDAIIATAPEGEVLYWNEGRRGFSVTPAWRLWGAT